MPFLWLVFHLEEKYELRPEMTIDKLKKIIQEKYKWALDYNFAAKDTDSVFWYRSEEKMETGLGMAPFLIKHPLLINNWIEKRERVLANIIYSTEPNNQKIKSVLSLTKRAINHLQEIVTYPQ